MKSNGSRNRHIFRGVLAGIGGGLVASWMMNVFIEGPGQALQKSLLTEEERRQSEARQREQEERGEVTEDATMKTADAIARSITGRHLSLPEKQKGGPIVHYGFGALMGALYGACAELTDVASAGFGTAFGVTLFATADMVAVPALHLSEPTSKFDASVLATPLAAHLVYGVTTELVRRTLRTAL